MSRVRPFSIPGSDGKPVLGDSHEPAGEAVCVAVIAHGFKGYKDYGMIPRIAAALAGAGAGFVAHRFNFSHSGMTNQIETFQRPDLFQKDTWNRQVFDLRAVVSAVQDGQIPGAGLPLLLLGHSRGGATCLLAAARHAEDDPPLAPAGIVTIAAPDTLNPLTDEQQQELLKRGSLESPSSRTAQALRIGRAFLEEQLREPEAHDLMALLNRIRCPVLVIHGAEDQSVPPAAAAKIARRLGDRATSRIIKGADHTFNTPNPLRPDAAASPQLSALLEAVVEFARNGASSAAAPGRRS